MALITNLVAQGIIDRAAYIEKYIGDAIAGGTAFYPRLSELDDPSVELVIGPAAHALDLAITAGDFYSNLQGDLVNALLQHLQRAAETGETKAVYATIDAWLTAVAWRVPIQFSTLCYRTLGSYLLAANVYDDVKTLGSFAITGSGTGTYTDGVALDTVHSGGNNVEAVCTTAVTSCSLTVTLTKPDATTEEKTITVVGAAGETVAIGSASDIYTNITTVTINSGGANLQTVTFRSVLDRALAL